MMRTLLSFVAFAAVAAALNAQAPRATAADRFATCQSHRAGMLAALNDIQARQHNVGMSAVVLLGGRTVLAANLGYADLEHRVPVTSATRFGIASINKAFTGVALLKEVERGRIDLDAPIQRYVPAFPEKPQGTITLRLLALHLAGIRHWAKERTPALYARHFEDINDVLTLFENDSLIAAPGSGFHYSSYGYNLLGAALQATSGMKYQVLIRREILEPLHLTTTGFDDVRFVQLNRAMRYSFFDPWTYAIDSVTLYRVPDWDYSHNMAGGNMYTTAADLAQFGRALTKPGLLTIKSLAMLFAVPQVGSVVSEMGFGFFVSGPEAAHRLIHIGGSNAGLQSALFIYPDDDLVVTVLANTWGIGATSGEMNGALPERIAGICLGWAK